ncbi:MAG: tRNA (guanine(10)-N(2))-dimethyltransferase [Promethearchaeota archaeon]
MAEYIEIEVKEGSAVLRAYKCAPGVVPTKRMPVFYNPRMALNRDLTVLFLQVLRGWRDDPIITCDPMAGSGVRSIRIAKEVPGVGVLYANDLNPSAVNEVRVNAEKNGVASKIKVHNEDARSWLTGEFQPSPTYVDIDPFGSPRWFVNPGLFALRAGGWLGVTATDTAVLCGAQRGKCLKNYLAAAISGEICKEVGLRVLLGFVARLAASLDLVVDPSLSFYNGHFFRLFVEVRRSARLAGKVVEKLGFVRYCPRCLYRDCVEMYPVPNERHECPSCGEVMVVGGPLWVAPLHKDDFLVSMLARLYQNPQITSTKLSEKILTRCLAENSMPPYFFNVHVFCDEIGTSPPPISKVIEELIIRGFRSTRTHFDDLGVKSTATAAQFASVLKDLERK